MVSSWVIHTKEIRVIDTRSMMDDTEPKMIRKIAILPKDDPRRQSLQCAQCHVEYNCGAGTDLGTGAKVGMNDPSSISFNRVNRVFCIFCCPVSRYFYIFSIFTLPVSNGNTI